MQASRMANLNLTSLVNIKRCADQGDIDSILGNFCSQGFNRANLKCAEAMRDGAVETAKEYAYTAKVLESLTNEFKRFVDDQILKARV